MSDKPLNLTPQETTFLAALVIAYVDEFGAEVKSDAIALLAKLLGNLSADELLPEREYFDGQKHGAD